MSIVRQEVIFAVCPGADGESVGTVMFSKTTVADSAERALFNKLLSADFGVGLGNWRGAELATLVDSARSVQRHLSPAARTRYANALCRARRYMDAGNGGIPESILLDDSMQPEGRRVLLADFEQAARRCDSVFPRIEALLELTVELPEDAGRVFDALNRCNEPWLQDLDGRRLLFVALARCGRVGAARDLLHLSAGDPRTRLEVIGQLEAEGWGPYLAVADRLASLPKGIYRGWVAAKWDLAPTRPLEPNF